MRHARAAVLAAGSIALAVGAQVLSAQNGGAISQRDRTGVPLEHFTVAAADGHPLALWARRAIAPKHVILLVHGRTWSSLPDFDLQVPGEQKSVLAALAARGYAAYALDLRGYGSTPRDRTGWDTPNRAAMDVDEALAWIMTHQPTAARPALLGWSNGSLVAQLAAQLHPDRISALVLYGYPMDPSNKFAKVDETDPPARERTTAEDAASDFITPGSISQRAIDAYVAAALKSDPVRSDWRDVDQFNALNAARLKMPTLLLQGEFDPALPHDVLAELFAKIGTVSKEWVTLKGGDHAALLEETSPSFVTAVTTFLERVWK